MLTNFEYKFLNNADSVPPNRSMVMAKIYVGEFDWVKCALKKER